MITLFTIPKPFHGHIALIQRNAIQSWTRLRPACKIILFGKDKGTAEIARELEIRHIAEVSYNEFGTPLVNSLFMAAERVVTSDFLCYINTDIILMSDFMKAVRQVVSLKRRFLMVGQRWDVNMNKQWKFEQTDWEERLRAYVGEHGKLHSPTGIDYFVFPRGLWQELPPFALGRTVWDNWLIYRARSLGVPVIDATKYITAVHQNHDYTHLPTGKTGTWKGPEAKRNIEIADGYHHVFTLNDATHVLTSSGLTLNLSRTRLRRQLDTLPIFFPYLSPLSKLAKIILKSLKTIEIKIRKSKELKEV
jgi:hypothetical protein